MSLILYHAWKSSASRRVRFFLEEKGLIYDAHEIDLAKQEQHQPAFLKVNPLGVVPALIHKGRALHESGTICEYLEAVFPEPRLCPTDPYDLAQMRNWVRHVDGLIGNLIPTTGDIQFRTAQQNSLKPSSKRFWPKSRAKNGGKPGSELRAIPTRQPNSIRHAIIW